MRGGPEALQKGDEDRLNQILGLRTSTVQPLRWAEPDLFEENHCRESPTFCNPFYSPSLLQVVILEQVVQQDILLYIFASVIYQLSSVSEPKTMSPVRQRDVDIPRTCSRRQSYGLCSSGCLRDVLGCDVDRTRTCGHLNVSRTYDGCRIDVQASLHYDTFCTLSRRL